MTKFKIGDAVRIIDDASTPDVLVVRKNDNGVILCVSECGCRACWEVDYSLELVNRPDPQADLIQAIREVLLSGDFMTKFAAAWMKTPIPIAIPSTKRDQELIESLRDYPFGEASEGLAITPVTGSESEAYYLDKLKKGETK